MMNIFSEIGQSVADFLGVFLRQKNFLVQAILLLIICSISFEVNSAKGNFKYEPILGKSILVLSAFAPGSSGIKFTLFHQEKHICNRIEQDNEGT